MPTQILMPALSPTMEEGTLAKWHVREGDAVRAGDVIAEIETDKATMEVEAVDEGRIGRILVAEGAEHVPVNKPIAVLVGENEDAAAVASTSTEARLPSPGAHSAPAEGVTRSMEVRLQPSRGNGRDRIFASPLARRLAHERGIDLATLRGSGPHGRIVKADVERAAEAERPARAEAPREAAKEAREMVRAPRAEPVIRGEVPGLSDEQVRALYEPGSYQLVPHDAMRRIVADRLTLAKQTIPHFYLSIDCKLEPLLAARRRLNATAPESGPRAFKLSVNDVIIKAMAMALQQVPAANATWTNEGFLLHRASDVAVAVAVPSGGLFTPVIRNAEVKSLSEISNEMKDLATRARSRHLAPHEYQGGTTTISNLGMYGISRFEAVINPPQASILAVGKAEKRPVVSKKDTVKIATMMSVTLSIDHRVIDGALGAELLDAFKAFIEDPVTMLV
jgi:pyruvate dehydrogenase E2 component (dihydrolipoamide acetyltransferase)